MAGIVNKQFLLGCCIPPTIPISWFLLSTVTVLLVTRYRVSPALWRLASWYCRRNSFHLHSLHSRQCSYLSQKSKANQPLSVTLFSQLPFAAVWNTANSFVVYFRSCEERNGGSCAKFLRVKTPRQISGWWFHELQQSNNNLISPNSRRKKKSVSLKNLYDLKKLKRQRDTLRLFQ